MSLLSKELHGESWFMIEQVDALRPFLMSIVSQSNHWMFIASNGGLTAGRKNAEFALFPYYTDDKLIDFAHVTGSCTLIRVQREGKTVLWEPFSPFQQNQAGITRNLYKNRYGNKVLFEEINAELGLTFRYQWNSSHRFGFVRRAELINSGKSAVSAYVVDGLQNLMPAGVGSALQATTSNLVDAYKRSECLPGSNLGLFALSAIIVDRAEPSEALLANTVFGNGLSTEAVLLSSRQLQAIRGGAVAAGERDVKGERGAYFNAATVSLKPGSSQTWMLVANLSQDHASVAELDRWLKSGVDQQAEIRADIDAGTRELMALVADSDGASITADALKDVRHYNNTLFNVMRGGIFDDGYNMHRNDFALYLRNANRDVHTRHLPLIQQLPEIFDLFQLKAALSGISDPDLLRLAGEYLPLRFSRRHGDPSRPWNRFSINSLDEKTGEKVLDYEGNWRDIFQNWEALMHSYPYFIEGMISRFLNATTFDGYNPYRVMKGGFDWESIEHDNPWSYIGYWGDHQIIYLLKFLEFYAEADPAGFSALLTRTGFVYANVPYRIKPYADIVRNPKDTVSFDEASDKLLRQQMLTHGADAALLRAKTGDIHRVAFMEKILASVLAKLSNFIPEAGIWLNTQRPEWNDANNALVGNGVSMVTLYYLRRYLKFFARVLPQAGSPSIECSEELAGFFRNVDAIYQQIAQKTAGRFTDVERRTVTDALGEAGAAFRLAVYANGFSGKRTPVSIAELKTFMERAEAVIDQSIRVNRRSDGLYHAYNLVRFTSDGVSVRYLYEMLEGQVGVLSSGYLDADAAANLLDAMRASSLYRADQNSYLLYPDRELPGFVQKNVIAQQQFASSALLQRLVNDGNRDIVIKDVNGVVHFSGSFKNAGDLNAALDRLSGTVYEKAAKEERQAVNAIFEAVFNHEAFTGRSGTFFGYEGLGSIYWHMVSKLHLALTEVYVDASAKGIPDGVKKRLAAHFDAVGAGIGLKKSPELYGAFPVDPYSHTPKHKGAQQPGMTGQVKEDILVRRAEFGVSVEKGALAFKPGLLDVSAFFEAPVQVSLPGKQAFALPAKSLVITCCGVPVVYVLGNENSTLVQFANGETKTFTGNVLDHDTTGLLFKRNGAVERLTVTLNARDLRNGSAA
jgi:hypothetical protein